MLPTHAPRVAAAHYSKHHGTTALVYRNADGRYDWTAIEWITRKLDLDIAYVYRNGQLIKEMKLMSQTKDFHLGDILSITTGMLVSPRHMEGVYDILNYMTGEQLFTHQLPRVAREAEPVLLRAHPDLANIEVTTLTPGDVAPWLAEQVAKFGEMLAVPKMTDDEHEEIDAMSEAAQFFPADKIITVETK